MSTEGAPATKTKTTYECPKCGVTMKPVKVVKPKRPPTEYNLYFKKHMSENKLLAKLPTATLKMQAVAQFWNLYKKNGKQEVAPVKQAQVVQALLAKERVAQQQKKF